MAFGLNIPPSTSRPRKLRAGLGEHQSKLSADQH